MVDITAIKVVLQRVGYGFECSRFLVDEARGQLKLVEEKFKSTNSAIGQLRKMKLVVDEYGECIITKGDRYYNDCVNLLQQHDGAERCAEL